MRYGILPALAIAVLISTGCRKDPHSVLITEKNKDTFLEEIKDMKGLTVEEMGLLVSARMTDGMGKAFGLGERKIVGKTVGELLDELRKEAAEQRIASERQKKLAAEVQAREEALLAELRKAIALTVASKGHHKGDFEEFVTIKVVYENTSGRDIRAFTGKVQFTDLFGKEIFESGVTISDPVKSGSKGTWDGLIRYNQFMPEHQRLRSADLSDMKIVWKPSSILFADGSKLSGAGD